MDQPFSAHFGGGYLVLVCVEVWFSVWCTIAGFWMAGVVVGVCLVTGSKNCRRDAGFTAASGDRCESNSNLQFGDAIVRVSID